jgi:5-methylcytosine-specific restriction protein A
VLTSTGRCDTHKHVEREAKKQYDKERGTAHQRGYTSKWTQYSKAYRERHPLCVECEKQGRLVLAEVVDHIIPHRGDMALFWDRNNHQGLCKTCHDRKTASEDGGFGNMQRRKDIKEVLWQDKAGQG